MATKMPTATPAMRPSSRRQQSSEKLLAQQTSTSYKGVVHHLLSFFRLNQPHVPSYTLSLAEHTSEQLWPGVGVELVAGVKAEFESFSGSGVKAEFESFSGSGVKAEFESFSGSGSHGFGPTEDQQEPSVL